MSSKLAILPHLKALSILPLYTSDVDGYYEGFLNKLYNHAILQCNHTAWMRAMSPAELATFRANVIQECNNQCGWINGYRMLIQKSMLGLGVSSSDGLPKQIFDPCNTVDSDTLGDVLAEYQSLLWEAIAGDLRIAISPSPSFEQHLSHYTALRQCQGPTQPTVTPPTPLNVSNGLEIPQCNPTVSAQVYLPLPDTIPAPSIRYDKSSQGLYRIVLPIDTYINSGVERMRNGRQPSSESVVVQSINVDMSYLYAWDGMIHSSLYLEYVIVTYNLIMCKLASIINKYELLNETNSWQSCATPSRDQNVSCCQSVGTSLNLVRWLDPKLYSCDFYSYYDFNKCTSKTTRQSSSSNGSKEKAAGPLLLNCTIANTFFTIPKTVRRKGSSIDFVQVTDTNNNVPNLPEAKLEAAVEALLKIKMTIGEIQCHIANMSTLLPHIQWDGIIDASFEPPGLSVPNRALRLQALKLILSSTNLKLWANIVATVNAQTDLDLCRYKLQKPAAAPPSKRELLVKWGYFQALLKNANTQSEITRQAADAVIATYNNVFVTHIMPGLNVSERNLFLDEASVRHSKNPSSRHAPSKSSNQTSLADDFSLWATQMKQTLFDDTHAELQFYSHSHDDVTPPPPATDHSILLQWVKLPKSLQELCRVNHNFFGFADILKLCQYSCFYTDVLLTYVQIVQDACLIYDEHGMANCADSTALYYLDPELHAPTKTVQHLRTLICTLLTPPVQQETLTPRSLDQLRWLVNIISFLDTKLHQHCIDTMMTRSARKTPPAKTELFETPVAPTFLRPEDTTRDMILKYLTMSHVDQFFAALVRLLGWRNMDANSRFLPTGLDDISTNTNIGPPTSVEIASLVHTSCLYERLYNILNVLTDTVRLGMYSNSQTTMSVREYMSEEDIYHDIVKICFFYYTTIKKLRPGSQNQPAELTEIRSAHNYCDLLLHLIQELTPHLPLHIQTLITNYR